MDNVVEAIHLARQFERARHYDKAIQCATLAAYFLNKLKRRHKAMPENALEMCDRKILECVKNRKRLMRMKQKIILKKFVLLHDNVSQ
ncbi:hypothetical protein [Alphabaculovirus myunipunctae]|uniref:Uncharacterized protein n=1 Tax=Mythimna unipuncta nucleopolyhedrovirus TaxID=447897 RepID=A0A2K9VS48_9ABAC|nr:hypothetical protein [Mythimna unipuncta nucleopolyhedrovirus]AUV65285.1 hypothetical protein [Mythimna unipuncta nucleopolyhedrovirus]